MQGELVEKHRQRLQAKLDALNDFEAEVVDVAGKLGLDELTIMDEVALRTVRSYRAHASDTMLFWNALSEENGQYGTTPNSIGWCGGDEYWWSDFNLHIFYITTQQVSYYYAKLPELRRAFEKAIEAL
jgi:hypothetical protein